METVKGLKRLLGVLEDIPKELEGDLEVAVADNASKIVRRSQDNLRKNGSVDTGRLLDSHLSTQIDPLTYLVKTNSTGLAPYGKYVEYGTFKSRAKPFFFPAVFETRQEFIKDIEKVLDGTFDDI